MDDKDKVQRLMDKVPQANRVVVSELILVPARVEAVEIESYEALAEQGKTFADGDEQVYTNHTKYGQYTIQTAVDAVDPDMTLIGESFKLSAIGEEFILASIITIYTDGQDLVSELFVSPKMYMVTSELDRLLQEIGEKEKSNW